MEKISELFSTSQGVGIQTDLFPDPYSKHVTETSKISNKIKAKFFIQKSFKRDKST